MNGAATQIASTQFDEDFQRIDPKVRELIQAKIDRMGQRLASFPHFRMTGTERFRLRVGDGCNSRYPR